MRLSCFALAVPVIAAKGRRIERLMTNSRTQLRTYVMAFLLLFQITLRRWMRMNLRAFILTRNPTELLRCLADFHVEMRSRESSS